MYGHPAHLMAPDDALAALAAFDRAAILVVVGADGLDAAQVPFMLNGDRLVGHLARANPLWRAAPCAALVICPGPEAYVSPSWYETKARTGKAVPTWNYEVLHVHGRLTAFEDLDRLRTLVDDLSNAHEAGRPSPWRMADAPADYIETMLRGFVGIEVAIDRIEGKRKLSQDKPNDDKAGVRAALSASDDPRDRAVAAAMDAIDQKT
jgi:transcriptional regulator